MKNLLDAEERIKSREKIQNTHIVETKKIFSSLPKSSTTLSYSCGDGMWDLILADEYSDNIQRHYATDIVDCAISQHIHDFISEKVNFQFMKVKADFPLDFEDKFFDLIFHHDVIEHTRRPHLMLSEQYRVLKEGGQLFFSTPNVFRVANILKLLVGKLKFPVKIGENIEIGDYIHEKEFFMEDLRILVEESNFSHIEVYSKMFGLVPLQLFYDYREGSTLEQIGHILFCRATK